MSENHNLPNAGRRDEALHELERALKSRERRAKAAPLGVVAATIAVIVLLVGGIYFAVNYQPNTDNTADSSTTSSSEPEIQAAALPGKPLKAYDAAVNCSYEKSEDKTENFIGLPKENKISTSDNKTVTITTDKGAIPVTLDSSLSPCTTNSFEFLTSNGFYDNSICHRSVKSASMTILQCGDPTGTGSGGPGYSFADEYPKNGVEESKTSEPLTYPRGTLAMANAGADTNGSQFFLVTQDTILPPAYNVFGTISDEGLKTLDAILDKAPDGDSAPSDKVTITSTSVK